MTLFDRTFVSDNWIANGYFAAKANIKTNFNQLNIYASEVESSEQFEAKLTGEKNTGDWLCFIFEYKQTYPNWQYCIKKEVLIQQIYINIITDCYPHEYQYSYSPGQNVILIFDEDDCLIGFAKEIVFNES